MGGDCLNTGCVPSKALIAAGQARRGDARGGAVRHQAAAPSVEFYQVNDHINERDRRDRAEQFQGALHRTRRAGDRGRGALHGREDRRGRRSVRDQGAALRHRDRLVAGGAADPWSRQHAVSHQRDRVRDARAARSISSSSAPARSGWSWRRRSAGSAPTSRCSKRLRRSPTRIPECAAVVLDAARPRGRDRPQRREGRAGQRNAEQDRSGAGRGRTGGRRHRDRRRQRSSGRHRPAADRRRARSRRRRHQARAPSGIVVDKRLRTSNKRVYAIGDVAGSRAVHPRRQLSRRAGDPPRAVPPAGQGRSRRASRASPSPIPSWPMSARRKTQARQRLRPSACCAGRITRTTAPRPSARPTATSR